MRFSQAVPDDIADQLDSAVVLNRCWCINSRSGSRYGGELVRMADGAYGISESIYVAPKDRPFDRGREEGLGWRFRIVYGDIKGANLELIRAYNKTKRRIRGHLFRSVRRPLALKQLRAALDFEDTHGMSFFQRESIIHRLGDSQEFLQNKSCLAKNIDVNLSNMRAVTSASADTATSGFAAGAILNAIIAVLLFLLYLGAGEDNASTTRDEKLYPGISEYGTSDIDCSDLSGPVPVGGYDPHGLDRDGDGVGCE